MADDIACCAAAALLPEEESTSTTSGSLPDERIANVLHPGAAAVLKNAHFGKTERVLTVSFLEQVQPDLKTRILSNMNAWQPCCIFFALAAEGEAGDVRITLTNPGPPYYGGFWSLLGKRILNIPKDQPTMCLENIMDQSESEFKRLVRHETGHTLGFPHEHLRKEIIERIDEGKAYVYFKTEYHWSHEWTKSNVLTALDPKEILQSTGIDDVSIMCYDLPGEIMKDGRPVPGGKDITDRDRMLVSWVYPKAAPASSPASGGTYTVHAGDTLLEIAQKFGTTLDAIVNANPNIADPDLIYPGQVIQLPGQGGGPAAAFPSADSGTYTVQAGDTLWKISQKFGTTVAAIMDANPKILNPNLIYPGQVMQVP